MWLGVMPQVAPQLRELHAAAVRDQYPRLRHPRLRRRGRLGYELRNSHGLGAGPVRRGGAIFILLFGTIVFFDQLSSRFRNRLIEGQDQ
jgi:phosphonate transport system permease protein